DRRVVASPAQARALLAGARVQGARGQHLEAFYGCLYYAALRPSEAVALRETDCHLPGRGWGRIDLAGSEPRAGRDWTDHGTARQASPLARRPYDLRHAAVSLWLNAGVPATEVARRAGHSIAVLLKVYAHCIDGQADTVNQRIADALGGTVDADI